MTTCVTAGRRSETPSSRAAIRALSTPLDARSQTAFDMQTCALLRTDRHVSAWSPSGPADAVLLQRVLGWDGTCTLTHRRTRRRGRRRGRGHRRRCRSSHTHTHTHLYTHTHTHRDSARNCALVATLAYLCTASRVERRGSLHCSRDDVSHRWPRRRRRCCCLFKRNQLLAALMARWHQYRHWTAQQVSR